MYYKVMLSLLVLLCFVASSALAQDDGVRIEGVDVGQEVLVAVSARMPSGEGCLNDPDQRNWRVYRTTTGYVSLKGINLRAGCALTFAAFARDRAMLLTTLEQWTDKGGEVRTVAMQPAFDAPMVIWITDDSLEELARRSAIRAVELYRENMVGFNLVPILRNISGQTARVDVIERAVTPQPSGPGSICSDIESLKGPHGAYEPGMLNVYYVKRKGLHRNCALKETPPACNSEVLKVPEVDGNVTYLGLDPQNILTVLAHELGHAFGLRPICNEFGSGWGHPILNPGIDMTNIMWHAGGDERAKFTLGQIFRFNTQTDQWGGTMIIRNGLRPGPGRECRLRNQESSTYDCPPLNLTFETHGY